MRNKNNEYTGVPLIFLYRHVYLFINENLACIKALKQKIYGNNKFFFLTCSLSHPRSSRDALRVKYNNSPSYKICFVLTIFRTNDC